MAALQTFNNALADSCGPGAAPWSDDTIARVCELAAKLSDEDLALLRVIWPDRPTLWQKRSSVTRSGPSDAAVGGAPYVELGSLADVVLEA
jgi:hypothetical protein